MAKRTILISSGFICSIVAVIAFILVEISLGQSAERITVDSSRSQIIALADAVKLTEVDEAIDKFITDYADNGQLHSNLLTIADSLAWRRLYEKADRLYRLVQEKSGDNSFKSKAGLGLGRTEILNLISQKKFSAAQQKVDSIIINFKEEPDLAATLFQIGQEFCWQRRFIEASEALGKGIEMFPISSAAKEMNIWLARANICALIWQAKDEQAISAIDKMISDFNSDAGLAEAIYWISKEYEWAKGTRENRTRWYDAPNSVYQRLIQQSGNSAFGQEAQWDQKRLTHRMKIFNLIKNGNQNEIDEAIENMVSELSGQTGQRMYEELLWIACEYEERNKIEQSRKMFTRIIREFPDTEVSDNAPLDIRRLEIWEKLDAEDYNTAEILINKFVSDFDKNPYASRCLKPIALKMYNKAEMAKATNNPKSEKYYEMSIEIWELMIDKLQNSSTTTPEYLYSIGVACHELKRYDKSITCLKRVIREWPDYKRAWEADSLLSDCIEQINSMSK